ncbi:MAG: DHH family phosphoesterase, partial [Clostridiales bacterium]|nr:DHH family phosphoesterase [Clostridiales bacterium]
MTRWMLRQCGADVGQLAAEAGIDRILASILAVRGYNTAREMREFIFAENRPFAPAELFLGLPEAVNIVAGAISDRRLIAVFGDYDVDGIMSAVILCRAVAQAGGRAIFYFPLRESEGYGLNNEAVASLKERGAEVILACDNGIAAVEQVAFARSLGMEVVIIDHHDVPFDPEYPETDIVPEANAIVNPKQKNCPYPFKLYCAAGLCHRFSEALFLHLGLHGEWRELRDDFLVFAALATVCDLVDLTGENRTIVKKALPLFSVCQNPGLRALIGEAKIPGGRVTVRNIGFILGPCINAAGRIGDPAEAAEL